MARRVILLPGDGIGPEITGPAVEVLNAFAPGEFEFEERVFGGASIDAHGTALTDEVLAACQGADAVLLAAVGGPKWDTTDPANLLVVRELTGGIYFGRRRVLTTARPTRAYTRARRSSGSHG